MNTEGRAGRQSRPAPSRLRVRISPYQTAPRIYEAALPTTIPPPLAAATAAALDAEVDWIESHATNVYRGTGDGPLERSVPLGH